jgi:hypothetical protein
MDVNKKILAGLVGRGACARLLPHPWNFTPMVAIGLYAGAKSSKLRTGVLATLLTLLLSDAVMGFYGGMWYVYAAWLIPVLIGRLIRRKDGVGAIAAGGLASSLSFFLAINFLVWAFDHTYPLTVAGLAASYAAGIPFYQNQLLGDVFYVAALFGGDALLRRIMQPSLRTA